jgi:hypothetical protein
MPRRTCIEIVLCIACHVHSVNDEEGKWQLTVRFWAIEDDWCTGISAKNSNSHGLERGLELFDISLL